MLDSLIKKHFFGFWFYYSHLKYRFLVTLILSLFIGVLDGFGLAMFLPLIEVSSGEKNPESAKVENFEFLFAFFEKNGIEITIYTILAFLLFFFVMKGIVRFIGQNYLVKVQQFFIRKLRLEMINSLGQISYKYFVTSDVGRMQNTLTGEVFRVSNGCRAYFKALEQAVLVLVYIIFAFLIDASLAILVTFGGVLANLLYKVIYKFTKSESKKLTTVNHYFQGLVTQFISNYKYLKATGKIQLYSAQLNKSIFTIEKRNVNIGFYNAILYAVREPLMIGIIILVIIIQLLFFSGELSAILISLLFFYRALGAQTIMQNQWNSYMAESGALFNLIDFQKGLNVNVEKYGNKKEVTFESKVELVGVEFNYGDKVILEGINLTVNSNETIALVGESGSGKTTLINIIAGLLTVEKGSIKVDGCSLNEIKRTSYQSSIGYITQDPVIFGGTIYENVTLWSELSSESLDRFNYAIEKASLTTFVDNLPNKENTILGNNGINLSGGQKQRIAIARELHKDIDILIMDEATSALDSETERLIQNNIDQLKGEYTIIIIAHRLSTIKNADRIVFMSEGKIQNIDDYYSLIKNIPEFKRLVELQGI